MQEQPELCRVPKFINFEYHQGQQLNTTLVIDNLLDKVVEFKIKSNKPQFYLVKPMEGSIYKKEHVKIVFKRQELVKSQFEAYLRNPASIQEKFLIEIKCTQQDVMGVEKPLTQSVIVLVKFNLESKEQQPQVQLTSDEKRQESLNELKKRIEQKNNELARLNEEEKKITKKASLSGDELGITKLDVVNIVVAFLLLGMAL